jgi:hypothetical protein
MSRLRRDSEVVGDLPPGRFRPTLSSRRTGLLLLHPRQEDLGSAISAPDLASDVHLDGRSETSQLGLAHAYADAAAALIDAAVASREPERVCYPIFFLYRHALELYLKYALPQSRRDALRKSRQGHDLQAIIREFEKFLSEESRGALRGRPSGEVSAAPILFPTTPSRTGRARFPRIRLSSDYCVDTAVGCPS